MLIMYGFQNLDTSDASHSTTNIDQAPSNVPLTMNYNSSFVTYYPPLNNIQNFNTNSQLSSPAHHYTTTTTAATLTPIQHNKISQPGKLVKKRKRRRFEEVERLYFCNYYNCHKGYSSLSHLNDHIMIQNHGPRRTPQEFKELRKLLKMKSECEIKEKQQQQQQQYPDFLSSTSSSSSISTTASLSRFQYGEIPRLALLPDSNLPLDGLNFKFEDNQTMPYDPTGAPDLSH